ncbi:hypothetical protein PhaeoP83_02851 [Phaeobacter inhibens]|uniref:Uncharacterized protein n=2 Tax=Phaeobacter inhibens TaxID=221822 RepID=A0ABN5GPU9_9RHOB|nr:hypothetical protein PhaeoP83_02851 [Phaeobacter inhibens]AUQ95619.1 hypothetical protein PhaeoP66_02862 [Phaeobacter inhibens]AUR20905.1 hypothetical protein PhaeoP80_02851 [Phaeobacter inhibens]
MTEDPTTPRDDFVGGYDVSPSHSPRNDVVMLSANVARLETSLDAEKEERLEERFRWVVVTSILFDVIAISSVDGSWLFVPIFMLQLIVLIGFAKAYGVDWAERLIGQLLHWVSEWAKGKSAE